MRFTRPYRHLLFHLFSIIIVLFSNPPGDVSYHNELRETETVEQIFLETFRLSYYRYILEHSS